MLKCNISGDVNYLHQGLALGMKEDREKNSASLGRLALFTGSSQVGGLGAGAGPCRAGWLHLVGTGPPGSAHRQRPGGRWAGQIRSAPPQLPSRGQPG
jgi:hypothetical protein